jgi:hypothetical protein
LKPAQAKRFVLAPVFLMVLLSLIHSAVFIVVALTLRGSTFSFGQSLFLSLVASVSTSADLAEPIPGMHQLLTVTLPPTVFHHASFYVDTLTIRAIGAWIDTRSMMSKQLATDVTIAPLGSVGSGYGAG